MKIFQFMTFYIKFKRDPKSFIISFDKIDGLIMVLHGHVIEVQKLVLQIALISILERSKLTHIILYLLKNKNKNKKLINIFLKKSLYKGFIFKWMFVYYKCYYYDRIDVFDRINFNRTSASKEYHY